MTTIKYGLTGGIGCGKSVCSRYLASRGVTIVDADKLTAQAYIEAHDALRAQFGESIYKEDDSIDRKVLSKIVFSDASKLAALNQIMHPIMTSLAQRKLNEASGVAVLDAALLYEAEWYKLVDRTVVVLAPIDIRIDRIIKRDQMTKSHALSRIGAQMCDAERVKRSDFIIYNMSDLETLYAQCDRIFKQ